MLSCIRIIRDPRKNGFNFPLKFIKKENVRLILKKVTMFYAISHIRCINLHYISIWAIFPTRNLGLSKENLCIWWSRQGNVLTPAPSVSKEMREHHSWSHRGGPPNVPKGYTPHASRLLGQQWSLPEHVSHPQGTFVLKPLSCPKIVINPPLQSTCMLLGKY